MRIEIVGVSVKNPETEGVRICDDRLSITGCFVDVANGGRIVIEAKRSEEAS